MFKHKFNFIEYKFDIYNLILKVIYFYIYNLLELVISVCFKIFSATGNFIRVTRIFK